MKKIFTLIISIIILGNTSFGQTDTSIYKNLKVVKLYSYVNIHKALNDCCPCLVQYYFENDQIKGRVVQCGDCPVGKFIYYYPNGNIQMKGSFRENESGNWSIDNVNHFCSIPHGTWTFYNKNGSLNYQEFWNNGQFLRQTPMQEKAEVWGCALMLDSIRIDTVEGLINVTIEDLKRLTVKPLFKNKNTNVSISINLLANLTRTKDNISYHPYIRSFESKTLKGQHVDIEEYLSQGKGEEVKLQIQLTMKADKKSVSSFQIQLVE